MDIIAPTKERLTKHDAWDTPAVDRKTKRDHHRIISVVEGMHRRGWVDDNQKQAFEIFSRHLEKAERVHVPMCQYGRAFASADDSPWDHHDNKTDAVLKVRSAVQAVGHPNEVRALALAALTETTLEKIGKEIDGTTNTGRAITAAKIMLQAGTYRLALHYQFIRGP